MATDGFPEDLLDESLGFPTRASAILAVEQARSWSSLIDAANRGLHCRRALWTDKDGEPDDFEMSKRAAALWSTASLPVRAGAHVEFKNPNSLADESLPGKAFFQAAFHAARELASALLAPLPGAWSGEASPLDQAILRAHRAWARPNALLGLSAAKEPKKASAPRPRDVADAYFSMLGAPLTLLVSGHKPGERADLDALAAEAPWPRVRSWEALREAAGPQPLGERARRVELAELESALDRAFERGGFSWLGAGVAGGPGKIASAAAMLEGECRSLGAAAGLGDAPVASLGFMSAGINLPHRASPGGLASFHYTRWAMNFVWNNPGGTLAHEWTHALDHLTRAQWPAALAASAPDPARPDAAAPSIDSFPAAKAHRALEELGQALGRLLPCERSWAELARAEETTRRRARFDLVAAAMALDPNDLPGGAGASDFKRRKASAREAANLILAIACDAGSSPEMLRAAFKSCLPNAKAGHDLGEAAAMLAHYKAIGAVRASLERSRSKGLSAFVAKAKIDDLLSDRPEARYHQDPMELLARSGEAYFNRGSPTDLPLRSNSKTRMQIPRHGELDQIAPLFERWLQASAPMIQEAARASAALDRARDRRASRPLSALARGLARVMMAGPKPALGSPPPKEPQPKDPARSRPRTGSHA